LQFPFISSFTSHPIGCETIKVINIPQIFFGVHRLTEKTVSFKVENVAFKFSIKHTFQNSWVVVIHPFSVIYKI